MTIDSRIPADVFATVREALRAAENAPERRRAAVVRSAEFERIKALPRRDAYAYPPELTQKISEIFRKRAHNDDGAPNMLFDTQAVALYEIAAYDGWLGNVTMGGGKTLISLLACAGYRSVIVLPAKLIAKTELEMQTYAKDWHIPGNITLISYEKLARVNQATFLEDLKPQRIICDEGHKLKHAKSAHRRIKRYVAKSKCSFIIFSGTLIGETLSAWAHVAGWALHQRSPAPLLDGVRAEWAAALAREPRIDPGALRDFGADFRDGYRERVTQSPGCYITRDAGISIALEIERFETTVSPALQKAIDECWHNWDLPTGETITDPLSHYRAMRQLELGCYYRWKKRPPDLWVERRLAWSQALRHVIRYSRHLDTMQAVTLAMSRGELKDAKPVYDAWVAIRDSFTVETECVWIDYGPVEQIAIKAYDGEAPIIWVHHTEIGAVFEKLGSPYYGAGGRTSKGAFIEAADAKAPIVASIQSNAEGRNLQMFGRSVIAEMPRDPTILEQLISRTHRAKQARDLVSIEVNTSTDASKLAWIRVLERSRLIYKNSGQAQRLLLATQVNPLSNEEIGRLTNGE